MISKELLSSVLDKNVIPSHEWESNIEYEYSINGTRYTHSINIYELAHNCKEWALENGFVCYTSLFCIDASCELTDGETVKDFKANTEPEAIFKACEWIINDN